MASTELTISKSNSISFDWKFFLKIVFFLLLLFGVVYTAITFYDNFDQQRRKKTEQNNNSGNGSKSTNNNKVDIKIDAQKQMYQEGKHFNKHGRAMGYSSKKEYSDAALKFAQENSKNTNAQIFEGTWNGTGKVTAQTQQIAISCENKTVILNKLSGQIIDFYKGTELRGLIKLITLQ